MPPDQYRYGGGGNETLLHPAVAVTLVIAIVCILVLPRKYAALPFLCVGLLVPIAQQIYVGGLHFFVLRLVILAGLVRVLISRNGPDSKRLAGGMNGVDGAFLVCVLAQCVAVTLLFKETQALVYEIGYLWDWLGGYFLLRWLIQSEKDVYRILKYVAVLMVPLTVGMVIEQFKLFNIFSLLGGLPAAPEMREGKIRSQGVFAHSLMGGCFAAGLVPLFFLLWKEGKSRLFGGLGTIVASVMMLTSNSSTPLLAYAAGIGGLLAWPLRKSMRKIRWGLALALAALQLLMKAPVWFLIARIDLTGGSSSYHRAALVDQFFKHFSDWWLIGTNNNADWGLDMWDVQNQYVNVGETGGLLALILFILVISRSFGRIGEARKLIEGDRQEEWILWLLGCSLLANTVGFLGVNYFDQSRIGWFLLLAMIAAVTSPILAKSLPDVEISNRLGIKRFWKRGRNAGNERSEKPKEHLTEPETLRQA